MGFIIHTLLGPTMEISRYKRNRGTYTKTMPKGITEEERKMGNYFLPI